MIARRLRHRGAFLASLGVSWIIYGIGILLDPTFSATHGLSVLTDLAPLVFWAWFWIVCGVGAICYAPVREVGRDTAGFIGILVPPLLWSLSYYASAVLHTYSRGWITGSSWAAFAVSVVIAARWPEIPKPVIEEVDDER